MQKWLKTTIDWGDVVRRLCAAKRQTVTALAPELGVSPANLIRLSNGTQTSTTFQNGLNILLQAQAAGVQGLPLRIELRPEVAHSIDGSACACVVLAAQPAANDGQTMAGVIDGAQRDFCVMPHERSSAEKGVANRCEKFAGVRVTSKTIATEAEK